MKKLTKELREKSITQLEKELLALQLEITKGKLSFKSNPPKDTNVIFKKRRKAAQILTVLGEKKELEIMKKQK